MADAEMTPEEKIAALLKEYNDPNTKQSRRKVIKLQGRALRLAIKWRGKRI